MQANLLTRIWDRLHFGKLSIYAALSVADLFMTFQLVEAGDGKVYESNPVAHAWLDSYGFIGLSVFKAAAVLMVVASALYISLHRPRLGGRLLGFGCLATAIVVGYSVCLAFSQDFTTHTGADDDVVHLRSRMLDGEMTRQRSYQALLGQLSYDLVSRRCSLEQAVTQLRTSEKAHQPEWLAHLQRTHPEHSTEECLAIHLGKHALVAVQHDAQLLETVADQLQHEFKATYGSDFSFDRAADSLAEDMVPPPARPTGPAALKLFRRD